MKNGKGMVVDMDKGKRIALTVTLFCLLLMLAAVIVIEVLYNGSIQKVIYPKNYEPLVETYAQENEVDEVLVYAVIYTESRFSPEAQSGAGARGLMQITEDTFDWIKMRLDDPEQVTFDDMYDPEYNIRYGTYLLGYLSRRFEDRESIICAYHAGLSCVEGWLQNEEYSVDGVHLNTIPYRDTAHYLYKVSKALTVYQKMSIQ